MERPPTNLPATTTAARPHLWRVAGSSVRGALHCRRQLPNQDALGWWPETGPAEQAVLAVADGHGSVRSPRSADGARLAVRVGLQLHQELLASGDAATAKGLAGRCRDWLGRALVERWRQAVRADLAERPLDEEEADRTDGESFLAYGTTFLAAAVTPEALLLLQLGDGDVLTVAEDGTVSRPLPPDARLFANETTSLCAPAPVADVRWRLLPLAEGAPALVLLSTDGYANSFADDAGFLRVGGDLLALIRSDGLDAVTASLETWLTEATEQGSGDDVTVGLLLRLDREEGAP